jgi:hypothetical protein
VFWTFLDHCRGKFWMIHAALAHCAITFVLLRTLLSRAGLAQVEFFVAVHQPRLVDACIPSVWFGLDQHKSLLPVFNVLELQLTATAVEKAVDDGVFTHVSVPMPRRPHLLYRVLARSGLVVDTETGLMTRA